MEKNYGRMTFVCGLKELRDIRAYAWYKKMQKKETMEMIINEFFSKKKNKQELDEALRSYFKK